MRLRKFTAFRPTTKEPTPPSSHLMAAERMEDLSIKKRSYPGSSHYEPNAKSARSQYKRMRDAMISRQCNASGHG